MISVLLPIDTPNPLNGSHQHWHAVSARRRTQRSATERGLSAQVPMGPSLIAQGALRSVGLVITLTRITSHPRGLDDDNLPAALKSIRDGVTDWLGLTDDSGPRLSWKYAQETGAKRGTKGVRIEIAARTKEAA